MIDPTDTISDTSACPVLNVMVVQKTFQSSQIPVSIQAKHFPRVAYMPKCSLLFFIPLPVQRLTYINFFTKADSYLCMQTVMTAPSLRPDQFFQSCIWSYVLLCFEISLYASHFLLVLPQDILWFIFRNQNQSGTFIITSLQPSISCLSIFKNKRCKDEQRAKVIRNKILYLFLPQTT